MRGCVCVLGGGRGAYILESGHVASKEGNFFKSSENAFDNVVVFQADGHLAACRRDFGKQICACDSNKLEDVSFGSFHGCDGRFARHEETRAAK